MAKKRTTVDVSEQVKAKAYELWERDGRNEGRDMEYWLQAEKLVKEQVKRKP